MNLCCHLDSVWVACWSLAHMRSIAWRAARLSSCFLHWLAPCPLGLAYRQKNGCQVGHVRCNLSPWYHNLIHFVWPSVCYLVADRSPVGIPLASLKHVPWSPLGRTSHRPRRRKLGLSAHAFPVGCTTPHHRLFAQLSTMPQNPNALSIIYFWECPDGW